MKVRYVAALIALPLVVTLTGAEQEPPTDGGGRARGRRRLSASVGVAAARLIRSPGSRASMRSS